MKRTVNMSGCACCGISRRNFLAAGCAACAGAVGLMAGTRPVHAAGAGGKFKIRVVYSLHAATQPSPDWPNIGFEFTPVMEQITGALSQGCPDFEFVTAMASGPEEAKKVVDQDASENIDGYVIYQMNAWNKVVQTVADTGKPVLYADFAYGGSGGFLVYNAGFLREKRPNIGFVSSSNMEDVVAAVKCFGLVKGGNGVADFVAATAKARLERTAKPTEGSCKPDTLQTLGFDEWQARMKSAKILAVRDEKSAGPVDGPGGVFLGAQVMHVPYSELNDAWAAADKDEAKAIVDKWEKAAAVIKDVSRETLETSAAMYLGEKAVLKKYGANAITINCLGGFYGKHIFAYPCLGFYELNNEGLVGGCECDVQSAATMLAFSTLTGGRPGYISDPVMDSAKRQIIYAHCVASNKAFGPKGESNPIEILTHSEDRQGACVRSILPVGYMTTTMELKQDKKEILFHQAKAVDNDPNDRACRTKLCGEPVGDFEKLFSQWDKWGWHRVTVYGDLKQPVFALADAIGWKVVEEA
ncbi:MAG: twin-arginine translocation signal domain-containing protein [Candidatus Hydrogenedentes bacterium]|nr:twin-arginine translocation signal domain-containing protein [Candidatus Hydrogenedentota bacterium]